MCRVPQGSILGPLQMVTPGSIMLAEMYCSTVMQTTFSFMWLWSQTIKPARFSAAAFEQLNSWKKWNFLQFNISKTEVLVLGNKDCDWNWRGRPKVYLEILGLWKTEMYVTFFLNTRCYVNRLAFFPRPLPKQLRTVVFFFCVKYWASVLKSAVYQT